MEFSRIQSVFRRQKRLASAVMIQHTLFSLPFAVGALVLETAGEIPWNRVLWIILAVIGARNGANAVNRLIDKDIDAKNPRTRGRHLPSGLLTSWELWLFTGVCFVLLITAAFMLGPLCAALLPAALGIIVLYSYSKRFTWLCHYMLGAAVAIAPMGTLIALTNSLEWRFFPIPIGVALWVAGFDIIYGCQDIDFDRKEGLFSIPARFGARWALRISTLSHAGTVAAFAGLAFFYPLGGIYWTGLVLIGILLIVEHSIVAPGQLKHIRTASYHINEIVGLLFMIILIMEVYI